MKKRTDEEEEEEDYRSDDIKHNHVIVLSSGRHL
jgi:hypothetical protein